MATYTITGFVLEDDNLNFKDTTYGNATASEDGLMSATDKERLEDAIQDISNIPVIKTDSFTGTTSASGNVGKQFANKRIVLSAYSTTGGVVVLPYPGAGADAHGQYTWWFHCLLDSATHPAYANQSITIYLIYIEI